MSHINQARGSRCLEQRYRGELGEPKFEKGRFTQATGSRVCISAHLAPEGRQLFILKKSETGCRHADLYGYGVSRNRNSKPH